MNTETEDKILDAALKLLEEKNLDKISVKDICDKCGINRNTFYYHFTDIYSVLDALLESARTAIKIEGGANDLLSDYDRRVAFISKNKKAVMHVYQSKHRETMSNYIHSLSHDFVSGYVYKAAEGKKISENDMLFICSFYECALEGLIYRWLENDMPLYEEDLHKRFRDIFNATIKAAFQTLISAE